MGEIQELLNVGLGLQAIREMLNIHPLVVHFPIALLLSSAVFYFSGLLFRWNGVLAAGRWTLLLGTISAALALWTGLEASETVSHGGATHEIMTAHQNFAFLVLGLSVILSFWVIFAKSDVPSKGRGLFLMALVLLCLVLVQGADLGGRMVFIDGVGVGQKSMLPEWTEGTEHEHHDHNHHAEEQNTTSETS